MSEEQTKNGTSAACGASVLSEELEVPAFPTPTGVQWNDGMSLRDYFAAKAMQGLIGDGALRGAADRVCSIAGLAYQQADSMLEARKAELKVNGYNCHLEECDICGGEGWVCESHPDKPWTDAGCKCNSGMPCVCTRIP